MERILEEIIGRLRVGESLTEHDVIRLVDQRNRERARQCRPLQVRPEPLMKRQLLPLYKKLKETRPEAWRQLAIDEELEQRLVELLRVKPRRSASGVATITVLTKPWPCTGACLYCPADVRMPKSYLADEPACRRAEGLWFDPYLQVANRLHHLQLMGHSTRKVELIIAGGTWQDYPLGYRRWFVRELLQAVNDASTEASETRFERRAASYEVAGLPRDRDVRAREVSDFQAAVNDGAMTYNDAVRQLYGGDSLWATLEVEQYADWDEVDAAWCANEAADARVVGLAVETRPELIDEHAIEELRRFGVRRVQLGLQSLDEAVLAGNGRIHPPSTMAHAFRLLRDGGFVIHGHYMLNLPGSTPELDYEGFRQLIDDERFRPDEVKLYPCVLVESAPLMRLRTRAAWAPYDEATLIALMADIMAAAPPWLRISRIVRDISAHDVVAGAHRPNARQLVEQRLAAEGKRAVELRTREIGTDESDERSWTMRELAYETSSGQEWFLAWEDDGGHVGAYARLTVGVRALLREVRELGADAAARTGLGSKGWALIERACTLASVSLDKLVLPPFLAGRKGYSGEQAATIAS